MSLGELFTIIARVSRKRPASDPLPNIPLQTRMAPRPARGSPAGARSRLDRRIPRGNARTTEGNGEEMTFQDHSRGTIIEECTSHVCTPLSCPEPGSYYVTCIDGAFFWKMSGPYSSHKQALNDVEKACKIASDHQGRAWFMSWGTARMADNITEPGNLQKAGLLVIS